MGVQDLVCYFLFLFLLLKLIRAATRNDMVSAAQKTIDGTRKSIDGTTHELKEEVNTLRAEVLKATDQLNEVAHKKWEDARSSIDYTKKSLKGTSQELQQEIDTLRAEMHKATERLNERFFAPVKQPEESHSDKK
jgi:F0F1-type ATP synthase membrane subunit b/b'